MPELLLVEDDPNLGLVIKDNLEEAGYIVQLATDGDKGWSAYLASNFDLCILDVMLPKKDGFTLARQIREKDADTPVLFLTAKSLEEDRLSGFSLGGDDYITKPFSMDELIMRIQVFLKRSSKKSMESSVYHLSTFTFDYDNLSLKSPQETFSLTQKEAEVLKCFCNNQGSVLKREKLLEDVWGNDDYFLGRSMDVFISKLRKYLSSDPSVKIVNHHGVGFKLQVTTDI